MVTVEIIEVSNPIVTIGGGLSRPSAGRPTEHNPLFDVILTVKWNQWIRIRSDQWQIPVFQSRDTNTQNPRVIFGNWTFNIKDLAEARELPWLATQVFVTQIE